jgi:hypothetical protein
VGNILLERVCGNVWHINFRNLLEKWQLLLPCLLGGYEKQAYDGNSIWFCTSYMNRVEAHDHLYYECSFSSQIWRVILITYQMFV